MATLTQTLTVAYRPSASARCVDANGQPTGAWYNAKDKTCHNGFPQIVEMTMAAATLPDQVVWSIAYTTHNRYHRVGESAAWYTSSGGCG